MAKVFVKGLADLHVFPVTTNTLTAYSTGTKIPIPSAKALSVDRKTEDFLITADDDIYASGSEFSGETIEITVVYLPLDLMASLDGADYDEESGEYSWGPGTIAPELALAFRALKSDGTYRMVKYYSTTVTSIKTEYKDKLDNKDGGRFTISLAAATRTADSKLYIKKDTTTAADLTWLDTMDAIPAA